MTYDMITVMCYYVTALASQTLGFLGLGISAVHPSDLGACDVKVMT